MTRGLNLQKRVFRGSMLNFLYDFSTFYLLCNYVMTIWHFGPFNFNALFTLSFHVHYSSIIRISYNISLYLFKYLQFILRV